MYYALILGVPLKHMLRKKIWIFTNSSLMVRFVQRDYTISRTLTIIPEGFKGWIQRFNGVATKYLNNYLAWFQVLESIQHQRSNVTMKDLMINGNLIQNMKTNDTLRLARFTI